MKVKKKLARKRRINGDLSPVYWSQVSKKITAGAMTLTKLRLRLAQVREFELAELERAFKNNCEGTRAKRMGNKCELLERFEAKLERMADTLDAIGS